MTIAFLNKLVEPHKSLYSTLCSIFGLNLVTSAFVLEYFGLKHSIKINELDTETLTEIENSVKRLYHLDEEVKKINKDHLLNILNTNSLRAMRHNLKLPVNGQRTHTNARTRKARKDKKSKGKSTKTPSSKGV